MQSVINLVDYDNVSFSSNMKMTPYSQQKTMYPFDEAFATNTNRHAFENQGLVEKLKKNIRYDEGDEEL